MMVRFSLPRNRPSFCSIALRDEGSSMDRRPVMVSRSMLIRRTKSSARRCDTGTLVLCLAMLNRLCNTRWAICPSLSSSVMYTVFIRCSRHRFVMCTSHQLFPLFGGPMNKWNSPRAGPRFASSSSLMPMGTTSRRTCPANATRSPSVKDMPGANNDSRVLSPAFRSSSARSRSPS